jgi:hypothetical protein
MSQSGVCVLQLKNSSALITAELFLASVLSDILPLKPGTI